MNRRPHPAEGQVLLALALLLAPLAAIALAVVGGARLVADQARLQAAVDAAAYSAAALEAEVLNSVAVTNRVLAAHLVTVGQLTSLVSHARAFDRLAEVSSAVGVAVPALRPFAALFGRATDLAVAGASALARGVVPRAGLLDRWTSAAARRRLLAADARLARRVEEVLAASAPDARLAATSRLALHSAPLTRVVVAADPQRLIAVATGSVDRFTGGRRSRPPFGRSWWFGPVRKSGTTRLGAGRSLAATDRIRVSLPGLQQLAVTGRALGSEFGHGPLAPAWVLHHHAAVPPIRIEATLESFGGHRLTARAAAAAVYRRPGHPEEAPNLFGPFWRPRLVPFDTAPTGRPAASGGGRPRGSR